MRATDVARPLRDRIVHARGLRSVARVAGSCGCVRSRAWRAPAGAFGHPRGGLLRVRSVARVAGSYSRGSAGNVSAGVRNVRRGNVRG